MGLYWTMLRFVDSNIELQVLYIVMYRYTVNHRVFKKKKLSSPWRSSMLKFILHKKG